MGDRAKLVRQLSQQQLLMIKIPAGPEDLDHWRKFYVAGQNDTKIKEMLIVKKLVSCLMIAILGISILCPLALAGTPIDRYGCETDASHRQWAYDWDTHNTSWLLRGHNWDNPARVSIDAMWRYDSNGNKITAPQGTQYGGWIYLYNRINQDIDGALNNISGTANRVYNNRTGTAIRYIQGGGYPDDYYGMRIKASSSCQASWGHIYFDGRWTPDY